jgi:hypothetical protein
MASGSGSAPAGDGTPLFPSLSVVHVSHTRTHTVKVRTRLDPHLVDPTSISICSYFDSTRRGLNLLINSHCVVLGRHPLGKELIRRLEGLVAEVDQRVRTITPPVRTMNENVVVALGPF